MRKPHANTDLRQVGGKTQPYTDQFQKDLKRLEKLRSPKPRLTRYGKTMTTLYSVVALLWAVATAFSVGHHHFGMAAMDAFLVLLWAGCAFGMYKWNGRTS